MCSQPGGGYFGFGNESRQTSAGGAVALRVALPTIRIGNRSPPNPTTFRVAGHPSGISDEERADP